MVRLRTYVVEDSPIIRENLVDTLEELVPMEIVGTAEDERSAVGWLREAGHEPDLMIIDIFLREGTGLGVLKTAHEHDPETRLVVFSNYATPELRQRCLELGATRVFDKSNEIDDLIAYCAQLSECLDR